MTVGIRKKRPSIFWQVSSDLVFYANHKLEISNINIGKYKEQSINTLKNKKFKT